jgi:hypothetical protein
MGHPVGVVLYGIEEWHLNRILIVGINISYIFFFLRFYFYCPPPKKISGWICHISGSLAVNSGQLRKC